MTDLTRDQMLRQEAALRQFQQRADDALIHWGLRAPAPAPDGSLEYGDSYRRKLLRMARDHLPLDHPLHITGIDKHMPMSVLATWEPQIYEASKQMGMSNDSAPPGQMRMVETRDPNNGQRIINFYGRRSFIEDLKAPVRYARIRNPDREPAWFTGSTRTREPWRVIEGGPVGASVTVG
jgi:hypothetical protein